MPVSWFTTLSGGAGGGGFGALRAAVALAAGANNNLNPGAGWPTTFGRLILTAPGGAANVTGLLAGLDNQAVFVFNNDPLNVITLNALNAGSLAANRFLESTAGPAGDLVLPPGFGGILLYDGPLAKWVIT